MCRQDISRKGIMALPLDATSGGNRAHEYSAESTGDCSALLRN